MRVCCCIYMCVCGGQRLTWDVFCDWITGLAGCQPSSSFSKRPCLKRVRPWKSRPFPILLRLLHEHRCMHPCTQVRRCHTHNPQPHHKYKHKVWSFHNRRTLETLWKVREASYRRPHLHEMFRTGRPAEQSPGEQAGLQSRLWVIDCLRLGENKESLLVRFLIKNDEMLKQLWWWQTILTTWKTRWGIAQWQYLLRMHETLVDIQHHINQVWWYKSIILGLGRWRREDQKFKAILGYLASSRLGWVTWESASKQQSPPDHTLWIGKVYV